jgi:ribonuclease HII
MPSAHRGPPDSVAVPAPELLPAAPTLDYERALAAGGLRVIAGIDEVGRGCLAGPVVAAAVILPVKSAIARRLSGVRDSKMLSPARRVMLAEAIRAHAIAWAIGCAGVEEITERNIVGATRLAMRRAIALLDPAPQALLLDAIALPQIPLPQTSLIKGDQRSLSIASASILAKVARDALMADLDRQHPGYGFAQHKGYGTPEHLAALATRGPCPIHRVTFAPVRVLCEAATDQPDDGRQCPI